MYVFAVSKHSSAQSLPSVSAHTHDGKHAQQQEQQQQVQVGVSIWQISVKLNETLCQLIECNEIPERERETE